MNYLDVQVNEERLKDLRRFAENERRAAAVHNRQGVMRAARRALGQGLVAAGRQLLDANQH